MSSVDAFAELGLEPDASEAEVRAAWRRLVSRWHPDRNGSASAVERMQRINQAYRTICRSGFGDDPQPEPGDAGGRAGGAPEEDDPHAREADPPEDAPRRTITRKLKLTLEEAAAGCTKVLQGKVVDACASCTGTGYQVLGGLCGRCDGAGSHRQAGWFGWLGSPVSCADCEGSGIGRQTCPACGGSGKAAPLRYKFTVRIPHGVRHADLLHVDGGRRRGGQPLDLDLRVELIEHPLFKLDDDGTTRSTVPVDGFVWLANRTIRVPTLGGPQALSLNRTRTTYRLPGQGFPAHRRGPPADHCVEIVPVFPEQLGTDQEILLDQLAAARARSDGRNPDDRLDAWNRSMRDWEGRQRGRKP